MNIRNILTKHIVLPLSDIALRQPVYKHLKFLQKSQWWSESDLIEYQNEKLRKLIQHAYKNVPFYYELFSDLKLKPEDIQTKKDLQKLPIISKEDLKRNCKKHIAKNVKKKDLIYLSSSGSTGEPFQFYKTKNAESFLKAAAIRSWFWMGYRLGDKYVKISMNERSSLVKKVQDKVNNCLYLSSKQLSPTEFKRIEKKINKFDPLFIRCYPVPLKFLSEQIKHYNGNNLIAINTTGSTLHSDIRKEIEEVFGVQIFDSYSCEGGTMFAQCPDHHSYHPAEEYAISEFIEDKFTFSDPEKPLRHITTDLHNYASPFIRYDTQDYMVLGSNKKCICGRNFKNVQKIKGRDSDILITPSGKYLIVENFVAYFEWIQEVDQIQIVQNKLDEIVFYLVVNKKFNESTFKKIFAYWRDYIGLSVKIIIKITDEIKLTPTGKRRTVIRDPKIPISG